MVMGVNQMFFASSILHVHLMQWGDLELVETALRNCDEVWQSIDAPKVSSSLLCCRFHLKLSSARIQVNSWSTKNWWKFVSIDSIHV